MYIVQGACLVIAERPLMGLVQQNLASPLGPLEKAGALLAFLSFVFLIAIVAYRFVELPCRKWVNGAGRKDLGCAGASGAEA